MKGANAHYSSRLAVAAYDLFHGGGMLAGDVDFYLNSARRYGSPLFEIGAGTGRVLIPLAYAGHEVVGLDISTAMLDVAAQKLSERPDLADSVQLKEGDMTDFDLNRQFSLVIISARSFQDLLTPSEQRKALDCTHRHRAPGGHLVLDLFDPYFELLLAKDTSPSCPREEVDPKSGMTICRTLLVRENDPMGQTICEVLLYEAIDQTGALVEREETSWTLRWSMRQEIANLLELCSFSRVALPVNRERAPRVGVHDNCPWRAQRVCILELLAVPRVIEPRGHTPLTRGKRNEKNDNRRSRAVQRPVVSSRRTDSD